MSYQTLLKPGEAEFTEKRSRFLSAAYPAASEAAALDAIARRKELFWDCSSTIYAYSLREGGVRRYSDGGEPQGTGGIPVLDVIQKEGLVDVCVVVNRYFGGTKLGAGGLVRAFSHAASIAVAASERVTVFSCVDLELSLDYNQYGILMRMVPGFGAKILDTAFEAGVLMKLRLKEEDAPGFLDGVREATSATVAPKELGRLFAPLGDQR